jgi:hypothetical protein
VNDDVISYPCPVEIGDRFYRKSQLILVPDRIVVKSIKATNDGYLILGRYMYHVNGKKERMFSDSIFKDSNWIIEKKGTDFEND